MKNAIGLLAFVAFGSAAADGHAGQPDADNLRKSVDAVFAPWSGSGTPGCAVGISRDGRPEYLSGYGMANLEDGVPIAAETRFHAASISKQFTAFAILLLAQEGKLSLDDDVRKYWPDLPDYGKPITLAQLMHHTAGLREQGLLLNLSGWRADETYTQDDMLGIIARQRGLNFSPGSEVVYNNAGYTVLAEVVRRVSGQALPAFAKERIFLPLGMTETHFREVRNEVVPHRASAYYKAGDAWRISLPNYEHYGSTNLVTTVGDLLKWNQNLLDARVGGKQAMRGMLTSGVLDDGTPIGYGGGLRLGKWRGLDTIAHNGADAGYRADSVLFPAQRLAVVALCNAADIAPDELTRKVAAIYLSGRLQNEIRPEVPLPDGELRALQGTYWSPQTDEVVRLEFSDGALRPVGGSTALVPVGGRVFRDGESTREWSFEATGSKMRLNVVDFWPTARLFERVDPQSPGPDVLRTMVGVYRSDDTQTDYRVRSVDGKLEMQWPRYAPAALTPIGGDRFLSPQGWTVGFTRNGKGAVDGLTISTRRLRRFRAERIDAASVASTE